jgi:xanthine/CO dehydrogenase XdhC/CoxF family maturation factor
MIGFDIGAETPEEIAISIAAEIMAVKKQNWRLL